MKSARTFFFVLGAACLVAPAVFAVAPEPGDIERGHHFARLHCSTCHAVEQTGGSPYKPAPPFRTLHEKYDVEGLAESLAEGIVVGHTGSRPMPRFVLDPDEIDDLLAYLKSLETNADSVADGRGAPGR